MKKSLMLAALAVTALGTAACEPMHNGPMAMEDRPHHMRDHMDHMPAPDQATADYMMHTAQLGMMAMQTAQIAQSKTHNSVVRSFADSEVEEQTTISGILTHLMPPGAPMPQLDAQQQAMVDQLRAMPAGKQFDKAFVMGQLDGHKMLLGVQNDYIGTGEHGPAMIVAMLAKGRIMDHIKLLEAFSMHSIR